MTWTRYAHGQLLLSWKVFWRNRRSTFIGFLLPVLLDLFVAAPLRDKEIGGVSAAGYVTVGFIGLALVTSFVNLLNAVVARRDDLVLKRLRGTEVPPSAVFAGQIGASGIVVLLQAVVLGTLSVGLFHAPLPADPALLLLTLVAGYLLFALLAVALSGLTPSAETSPLVATPVLMLCMFGAGVATPLSSLLLAAGSGARPAPHPGRAGPANRVVRQELRPGELERRTVGRSLLPAHLAVRRPRTADHRSVDGRRAAGRPAPLPLGAPARLTRVTARRASAVHSPRACERSGQDVLYSLRQ